MKRVMFAMCLFSSFCWGQNGAAPTPGQAAVSWSQITNSKGNVTIDNRNYSTTFSGTGLWTISNPLFLTNNVASGGDYATIAINTATGRAANLFGLYIADQTAGMSNYNIWSGPPPASLPNAASAGWLRAPHVFTTNAAGNVADSASVAIINEARVDAADPVGLYAACIVDGAVSDATYGVLAAVETHNPAGKTVRVAEGIFGVVNINGAGPVTMARGVDGGVIGNPTGPVMETAALAADSNTVPSTYNYGLLVADQTAGLNNWAIKTGLGLVSFGDLMQIGTKAWALLGTPANGSIVYCADCDAPTVPGAACTSGGARAGAEAHRVRGSWICF